jgi:hypothetical protein
MGNYQLTHLKELESEAMYVLREVAAQFERPVLLFSGGKDSIVLVHLSRKAFYPANIPFPLLHIDTGHNFPETLEFRDQMAKSVNARLLVGSVQESIDTGRAVEEKGINASRNVLQTVTLLDAIEKYKFDAAIGGARRDEEKARAKERFFRTVMNLASGIPKTSDRNSGTCSTEKNGWVSISGYSPSAIGPRWMCGNTYLLKTSTSPASILPMNGMCFTAMAFGLPRPPLWR